MMQIVKGDPVKIAIGTAVIAMTVALDGDGTTTHMITISAMFALYLRIGMNPLILGNDFNALCQYYEWYDSLGRACY